MISIRSGARYVELQCTSHFSFLRGASSCDELFAEAARLGIEALAIADRNSLAGIVRAHEAARAHGVRLIVGCRLDLSDGLPVLVYPTDRPAYARLCRLLSLGKQRGGKAKCILNWSDLAAHSDGLIAVLVPDEALPGTAGIPPASFPSPPTQERVKKSQPRPEERPQGASRRTALGAEPVVTADSVLGAILRPSTKTQDGAGAPPQDEGPDFFTRSQAGEAEKSGRDAHGPRKALPTTPRPVYSAARTMEDRLYLEAGWLRFGRGPAPNSFSRNVPPA
jgi:PHP domain